MGHVPRARPAVGTVPPGTCIRDALLAPALLYGRIEAGRRGPVGVLMPISMPMSLPLSLPLSMPMTALATVLLASSALAGPLQDLPDGPPPPPPPTREGPMHGEERIRVRFGVFPAYGTLVGRMEKEDSNAPTPSSGSGGDKVSLRSDLDMPLFSWSWRTEALLEPAPHLRLRFGAEFLRVEGGNTLSEGFRHDGRTFDVGDRIESELWGSLLDAEFHFLPRQALRRNAEIGLLAGVRFGYFENEVERVSGVQPAERVTGRTTGIWPRFGVQGYGPLGSGMTIWGQSVIGGWISGDANNFYAAASFDFAVGLGWARDHVVDVRVGYHYSTFGIWRERSNDMERLTLERSQFVFGVLFWTP